MCDKNTQAWIATVCAVPLALILIPFALVSLLYYVIIGLIVAYICCRQQARPEADDTHTKIPDNCPYRGNIFGYFKYIKGWPTFVMKTVEKIGARVYTDNCGWAAVMCVDGRACESLLHAQQKHGSTEGNACDLNIGLCPYKDTHPLFQHTWVDRDVKRSQRTRQFIFELQPTSPEDEVFAKGVNAMKEELERWASMDSKKLSAICLNDIVQLAIMAFTSAIFLNGNTIDPKLMKHMYPIPHAGPKYPWLPGFLNPMTYGLKVARRGMHNHMRAICKQESGAKLKAAIKKHELTEEQAFDAITTAIGFNASGQSNSMLNALYLLPHMPQNYLDDPEVLDSFCWELLRFNGPPLEFQSRKPTEITDSSGKQYKVREGVMLVTITGQAQATDSTIWPDAEHFQASRFTTANGSQPKPTLGFGCPLNKLFDEKNQDWFKNESHACTFSKLHQPWIKVWVKLLRDNFQWQLSEEPVKVMKQRILSNSTDFVADFSPKFLTGGIAATLDMTPLLAQNPHFVSFTCKGAAEPGKLTTPLLGN